MDQKIENFEEGKSLQEGGELSPLLQNICPVGIFRTNEKGDCTLVNKRWTEIAGLALDQALTQNWLNAIHPDDQERIASEWSECAKTRPEFNMGFRIQRPDGTIRWVVAQFIAERNSLGELVGYIGTITDITESKQIRQNMKDSESRYRLLFENSPDGVFITSGSGDFMDVNPSGCSMFGYKREELLKLNIRDVIEPSDIDARPLSLGVSLFIERRFRRKNGDIFFGEVNVQPSESGYLQGIVHDITYRKKAEKSLLRHQDELEEEVLQRSNELQSTISILYKAEEALRKTNERLELAIKNAPITIYEKDLDLKYTWLKNITVDLKEEDFAGKKAGNFTTSAEAKIITEVQKNVIASGVGRRQEITVTILGQLYYYDTIIEPLRDSSGKIIGISVVAWDISELRRTQKSLFDFKFAMDAHSIVAITDKYGKITHANENFCKISQYSLEELVGQDHRILNSGHHKKEFFRDLWKTIKGNQVWRGEVKNRAKDGSFYWVNTVIVPFFDSNGEIYQYYSIRTVITEQKQAEEALRLSEEKYRSLFEGDSDAILIFDLHTTRFEEANPAALKMFGYSKNEFLDLNLEDISSVPEQIRNNLETIIKERNEPFQIPLRKLKKKDGTIFPAEVIWGSYLDGESEKIIGAVRDITERRHMVEALFMARERAETADMAKSQFLSNMSHEIRTPLNAIVGFTELLQKKITDEKLLYYVNSIRTSGKMLLRLINDFLDHSSIESGKIELDFRSVNLRKVFEELNIIFSHSVLEKNIDFSIEIEPDVPEFLILDRSRILQVLLNIIGNAIKFTENGFVKVSVVYGYHDNISELGIMVEDTGIGIPIGEQDRIFDPFAQSRGQDRAKYGGTGLGLAISKRLISLMGGNILIRSQLGKGSVFSIKLRNTKTGSLDYFSDSKHPENLFSREQKGTNDHKKKNIRELEELPEKYSPVQIQKLKELYSILIKEKKTDWESLVEIIIVDNIINFSNELIHLGVKYEYPKLVLWAEEMKKYSERYDLESINDNLIKFPELLNQLYKLSERTMNLQWET